MAGAMLGGPWLVLLAIAGFGLGSVFDSVYDPDDPDMKDPQATSAEISHEARRLFAGHLALLLFKIARARYGDATAVKKIKDANPGLDADHIKAGQKINLP